MTVIGLELRVMRVRKERKLVGLSVLVSAYLSSSVDTILTKLCKPVNIKSGSSKHGIISKI